MLETAELRDYGRLRDLLLKKSKQVWREIALSSQSMLNSNYITSCTVDATGLRSVDLRRRGRDLRNPPHNSQSSRWKKRKGRGVNRDLPSKITPQSKAGESGEAEMTHDNNNNETSSEEIKLRSDPTYQPVETPSVATDQQSECDLHQERNTPSVDSIGATSSVSASSGGSKLAKLDELADKIKANPD
nr:hypothetical protein HmN_000992600 [Hymenolepis microstoma]